MSSYSLHSYSSSDSSSGRSISDDHRDIAEQGVSPIGASLGSTSDMGSSSSDKNERVRLDGPGAEHRVVESPASSNNVDTDDDWVVQDVRSAYSRFLTPASLKALVDVQDIVDSSIPDYAFSLRRCLSIDRVFHGRSSFPVDFFFMYAQVMKDSCIVIPFDDFCSDVLRFLNVAPTQLHLNGWAYLRAFQFVCSALAITPTIPLFFTHYSTRPGKKVGWVSLISQSRNCLFKPYSSSYKHFKDTFVKIAFGEVGREYIFYGDEPRFPLYWTRSPVRVAPWSRSGLSAEDTSALAVLDSLPRDIPARDILNTYWCENPNGAVFGTFFPLTLSFYLSNCLIILLLCIHPCCPDARHEQGIQGPDVVSTSWGEQQAGCQR